MESTLCCQRRQRRRFAANDIGGDALLRAATEATPGCERRPRRRVDDGDGGALQPLATATFCKAAAAKRLRGDAAAATKLYKQAEATVATIGESSKAKLSATSSGRRRRSRVYRVSETFCTQRRRCWRTVDSSRKQQRSTAFCIHWRHRRVANGGDVPLHTTLA
eukprot:717768-Pleurochrysis_carterae.AAC.1